MSWALGSWRGSVPSAYRKRGTSWRAFGTVGRLHNSVRFYNLLSRSGCTCHETCVHNEACAKSNRLFCSNKLTQQHYKRFFFLNLYFFRSKTTRVENRNLKACTSLKDNPGSSKSDDGITNAVVIAKIWKVNEPLVVPTPVGRLVIFDSNQKGRGVDSWFESHASIQPSPVYCSWVVLTLLNRSVYLNRRINAF